MILQFHQNSPTIQLSAQEGGSQGLQKQMETIFLTFLLKLQVSWTIRNLRAKQSCITCNYPLWPIKTRHQLRFHRLKALWNMLGKKKRNQAEYSVTTSIWHMFLMILYIFVWLCDSLSKWNLLQYYVMDVAWLNCWKSYPSPVSKGRGEARSSHS